jgi:hypothetical protein
MMMLVVVGGGGRRRRRIMMMMPLLRQESNRALGLFGAVDIGQGAYWWDYGQLKLYYNNNIRVTGVRARAFAGNFAESSCRVACFSYSSSDSTYVRLLRESLQRACIG